MRLKNIVVAAMLLTLAPGLQAATRVYFVEPKELHEGKVAGDQQHGIRQSFVACADSIAYIEWFCAELSGAGRYKFDILEKATSQLVCWGSETLPTSGWRWIRCDEFTGNLRLTKGKEYLLKVSHSNGDSEV